MSSTLTIRPAGPRDGELLTELLRGLSPDSAYLRFQTGIGPGPWPALVDALLPGSLRGGAFLGLVGSELVAHGVWVRVGHRPAAEIGLVVADAHQGLGIGTRLATALIADLTAHGVEQVEVFASATNDAVIRMVARQAPDAVRERDGATVTYTFPARTAPREVRTVA